MDFTLDKYSALLDALKAYPFESLTLRHDVDLKPQNSLRTAKMEAEKGLYGIFYFRAVPESWDEAIIREIASLGHEIGYHYESLTTCKGDVDKAYEDFCKNLEALRRIVPVRSISMHGSPHSKESHGHRPSSTLEPFRPRMVQGTISAECKKHLKKSHRFSFCFQ